MQAELEKIHRKNEEALKEIGKLEKENKKQEEINKKLNKIIQKLKGPNSTNSNTGVSQSPDDVATLLCTEEDKMSNMGALHNVVTLGPYE